jgi:hypothetical protein
MLHGEIKFLSTGVVIISYHNVFKKIKKNSFASIPLSVIAQDIQRKGRALISAGPNFMRS